MAPSGRMLLLLYLLVQRAEAFLTYRQGATEPAYGNTPVPRGYQPPPNPPTVDPYEAANTGYDANGGDGGYSNNNNNWNRPWVQDPTGRWIQGNSATATGWSHHQAQPPAPAPPQTWQQQQTVAMPQPSSNVPALVRTLIQVFANEQDPNSLVSETRTVTRVDGEERVEVSRELNTRTGNLVPLNTAELLANPRNFARVRAFAATNATHLSDADLERELDRELEAAIPHILDELDELQRRNRTNGAGDVTSKDLEKLIEDALVTIDDPEKRAQAERELERIKSITREPAPTTTPTLVITKETTTTSSTITTSYTTARPPPPPPPPVEDSEADANTQPPLIVFDRGSTTPSPTEAASIPESEAGEEVGPDEEEGQESVNPPNSPTISSTTAPEVGIPESEGAQSESGPSNNPVGQPEDEGILPSDEDSAIPTQSPSTAPEQDGDGGVPFPVATTEGTAPETVEEPQGECDVPNDESDSLKGDVLFLLDGSKSANQSGFGAGLRLIADTVRQFRNVGPAGIQVSLLQYNTEPYLEFSLRKHNCITRLLEDIQDTAYMNGDANLGRALEKAIKYAFTKQRGDRADAENVLVLIADGPDAEQVQIPLELAKKEDTTLLVVGAVKADPADVAEWAPKAENDRFRIGEALKKPLPLRLADRIRDILSGRHDVVKEAEDDNDVVVLTTPSSAPESASEVAHDDETLVASTELNHHLPATYSEENVHIECLSDGVTAQFNVPEYFSGHISTKDFEDDSACHVEVPQTHPTSENLREVRFTVHTGQCGLNSLPSVSPRGRNHSVVITLFHHQNLKTAQDRSYIVHCFIPRRNIEHTIETRLEVNGDVALSKTIELGAVPPSCEYTLRRDSPNGPVLQTASIGQIIYHRWECKASDEVSTAFGLFVHDCVAMNGTDRNYEIIDTNGCAADKSLLGEVEYANDRILAHVRAHVFTFVNVQDLIFSCKVNLCVRDGDGCEGITPPVCAATNVSEVLLTRRARQMEPALEVALSRRIETQRLGLSDPQKPEHVLRLSKAVCIAVLLCAVAAGALFGLCLYSCKDFRKPARQPAKVINVTSLQFPPLKRTVTFKS